MRARNWLLAAPLALIPLQSVDRDGPFSFTRRRVEPPRTERTVVHEVLSGTGPARSPFGDAQPTIR